MLRQRIREYRLTLTPSLISQRHVIMPSPYYVISSRYSMAQLQRTLIDYLDNYHMHIVTYSSYQLFLTLSSQTKPETRPSLDEILQHSFFTRSGVSTPSQLPESALRDVPMFAASDVVDSVIGKKINKITTEVYSCSCLHSTSCHTYVNSIFISILLC